jgi:hypothetical protein
MYVRGFFFGMPQELRMPLVLPLQQNANSMRFYAQPFYPVYYSISMQFWSYGGENVIWHAVEKSAVAQNTFSETSLPTARNGVELSILPSGNSLFYV